MEIIAQLDLILSHPIVVWGLASLVSFGGSMVGIKVGMARIEGKMAVQDEKISNVKGSVVDVKLEVAKNETRLNDHGRRISALESVRH